jgi:hypothetical protein
VQHTATQASAGGICSSRMVHSCNFGTQSAPTNGLNAQEQSLTDFRACLWRLLLTARPCCHCTDASDANHSLDMDQHTTNVVCQHLLIMLRVSHDWPRWHETPHCNSCCWAGVASICSFHHAPHQHLSAISRNLDNGSGTHSCTSLLHISPTPCCAWMPTSCCLAAVGASCHDGHFRAKMLGGSSTAQFG